MASWDGFAPDPGRDPNASIKQLQSALDMRVDQRGSRRRLKKHVWHCSIRTAPEDRLLSDEEWAEAARRVVAAAGIAPDGDPDGCRWVAVRHADNHIHIAATIVRGDLLKADIENDFNRAQAECRKIEKEWGLRELKPGDGTAAKEPTNREKHKAQRQGQPDTSRQQLRDAVRQALAGAASEAEFFARLEKAGVLVNRKVGPSGDTLGYSVALVGERDAAGEPVWFGGYKLAPDLTLPKIRKRLAGRIEDRQADSRSVAGASGGRTPAGRRSPAAAARLLAADAAVDAIELLDGEPEDAAGVVQATGEVLDALAATALPAQKQELLAAARAYERASRSHVRAANANSRTVRAAARAVLSSGYSSNRGPDGAAAATVLSALILLVIAASRWHAEQGHRQQAAAARAAADQLRAAYRQAAAQPMAALRERGRQLPKAVRERQEQALRRAVPGEGGRQLLAEPEFDALAAALAEAEAAGHDPKVLLERARSWRELDTADSVTAVLTWRVRHIAKLPRPAEANRPIPAVGATAPIAPATDPRRRR
ncbi:mobilization protein [Kitasatospora aureofaciens]|uniref:relaxase/mobilization nuclease domain-containing protein n=1 Tax=Kitasatospora aureofaciens TaxID=1894 RepID=UPI001C462AFE|nr:mobilization protein [Kitasatospora aureofaciens]MBV6695584.1 mobilization protein [Kitasatospora aureofaciens]